MDLSTIFGKEIPSRNPREKRSVLHVCTDFFQERDGSGFDFCKLFVSGPFRSASSETVDDGSFKREGFPI